MYIEDGFSSGRKRLVHCLPCLWQSAQVVSIVRGIKIIIIFMIAYIFIFMSSIMQCHNHDHQHQLLGHTVPTSPTSWTHHALVCTEPRAQRGDDDDDGDDDDGDDIEGDGKDNDRAQEPQSYNKDIDSDNNGDDENLNDNVGVFTMRMKDTESDKNGDFNSNFQQREHLRTTTFSKPPVFAAQLEVEPKPK